MATNNNAELIDDIVASLDRKVIDLEYYNKTHVSMKVEDVVKYLKGVLALAKDDQTSRKFDLTIDAGENTTVTVTSGESTVSGGANVLTYGDVITISASAGTGYTLSKFKINGKSYNSNATITVTTDIAVETEATADEPVES